jgi:hypothetical protein
MARPTFERVAPAPQDRAHVRRKQHALTASFAGSASYAVRADDPAEMSTGARDLAGYAPREPLCARTPLKPDSNTSGALLTSS